ncbi:aflO/ omtB/ dmtA/ O-methyltransferase B [Aspergillus ochraceoroseus]|uniref:AflO/ omtB/ dmtA/ O-methyltransferase B n=2 Tax=Aspergillus ochraceoroseus TaxID=138278 RepID=A0A0F8WXN5_9EURO|nr:aflO/ omtB/ dmtA/ O-methyltransferase B [Aspergillus ochraceoroseus]
MPCYAVLGATGNTGRALVQVLLDRTDHRVHAYCRSQEKLFRLCPAAANQARVSVFEGGLHSDGIIDECLRGTDAVFLVVAIVDNMPGCTVAMETAEVVVASLQRLKAASPTMRPPRLIMLSSASLEESFCDDVPPGVHWVLKTAVSHLYHDLAAAETFLRAQSDWLSATFVKPGGLVHDEARGHEVRLDKAKTPLSFLDLAGGMIEVAEAVDDRYDMHSVSVIPTSDNVKFPMDAIFKQIKEEYAKSDDNGKRQIQGYIRELQVGFYSDWDVVMRLSSGPLQVALAKVAIDLGIFRTLKESETPVTLAQFVEKTGASPRLLGRILRTQASFGLIKETGPQEYTSSAFTDVFVNPDAAGAIAQLFDISGPCTQILPDYLAERNYQDITSNKDCVFQKAFNTDVTMFEWMPQYPKHMQSLGHLMALKRPVVWVDYFPVLEELGDFPGPDKALMVDVGGGFGQQSKALRAKFPNLAGRVIVQDIPQTLAGAQPAEGVEFIAHNFFEPQPIQGAKFYYLRHVFHDWPDEQCVQILKQIIPVMGPHSCILIDEVVIPAVGVPWQAAFMDILMMDSLGGVERTRAEWDNLMEQAGLKIIKSYQYDGIEQAIMMAVRK